MATTTPNYGWTVPTSSDLVKNGATAIETLGDSVDASLWNVGFGQAGKNKLINGDFRINQRAFTSVTANNTYGFDRWPLGSGGDGTVTYTPQTFTLGAAPVAGYEGKNYARVVTASQTNTYSYASLDQRIESVRNLAGQTATISFWAQAGSGTPKVAIALDQNFGTGGSPSSTATTTAGTVTLSTSWARYSVTVAIPSISGKTLGTNNNDYLALYLITTAGSSYAGVGQGIGLQNATINFWGVQVEAGSVATPFQTATGTIQGELAACQRYYVRFGTGGNTYEQIGFGMASDVTYVIAQMPLPVSMRVTPSAIDFSTLRVVDTQNASTVSSVTFDNANRPSTLRPILKFTTSGSLTQYRPYFIEVNNSTSGYLGLSAEL